MKTYRPAPSRCIGSLVLVSAITAVLSAAWIPFCKWIHLMHRLDRGGRASPLDEAVSLYGVLAVVVGTGLIFALLSLSLIRARYEVGATDIVIHHGLFWRSTRTIPILDILRIEAYTGPLQRWLGCADLHLLTPSQPVYPVKLCGIAGAEELRRHLLDRRENLRELLRSGDLGVSGTSGEILLERLAKAVERLEQRLPHGASKP